MVFSLQIGQFFLYLVSEHCRTSIAFL